MPDPRSITLAWPLMLWLLLLLPLIAALYWHGLARRRRNGLRYANLVPAIETASRWRRHTPPVLLLLALASLLFAITRPSAVVMLPSRVETVMLAIDASGSMRATDVKPDRISAAQSAAKTFIDDQPGHVRIGVVAVAGGPVIGGLLLLCAGLGWSAPLPSEPSSDTAQGPADTSADTGGSDRPGGYSGAPDCGCSAAGAAAPWWLAAASVGLLRRRR